MHSRTPAFVLATALLSAPGLAAADPPVHLQTTIGTDAPLAVNVRADLELPGRLRLMASGGVTPDLYLSAFNGIVSASAGTQSDAGLSGIRLTSATSWRVHAGWRPAPNAGLLLMGGYGRVDLSGEVSARELITSVTGLAPPANVPEANGMYDVTATLHTLNAEIGWEFLFLGDHLALMTAVGLMATVDSRTTITPRFTSTTPGAADARRSAQDSIDQVLRSYAFVPTFSLSLGYRFF